jgi:hypothetical protein
MQKIKVNRGKIIRWIFVIVTLTLGVNAGRLVHSRLRFQEVRRAKPIPYTVVLRETVYGPDGTASVAADETFAVRSDGSYVKRLAHKRQGGNKLVDSDSERTIFFASGIEVQINDIASTKSTMASKLNPASLQRDPNSKCINTFVGRPSRSTPEVINGEEVIAGYKAVKASKDNWTWWFALDHGCATVKVRIDWGSQGYSEKNLVALIPGEPASALFDIPADDREMPPSERVLGRGKDPSKCGSPKCAETLRMLDDYYNANRPKK